MVLFTAEDAVTDFLQFGKSGGGAPLRDKDGRLITGVGGKFKKDYYVRYRTTTTRIKRQLISGDNSYQFQKSDNSYQTIAHINQNSYQKIKIYIRKF